jgi:two-component system, NarL family, sensor kinase
VSPARSLFQFALAALAAVVLLGVLAAAVLRHNTRDEAIREAKDLTRLAGRGIAQPALTPGIYTGDPAARRKVWLALRKQVLAEPVVRVKIWTADGHIIWSDQQQLIGQRFPLGREETEALRKGRTNAEVSDLSRPENRFERHYEKLLEVYLPIRGPGGTPLLFESYSRFSSITESGRRQAGALVLPLIGTLFLLWLATLPLAWRLARRLQQRQLEREALLQRAIDAQDRERRRIAGALHDDVVQDLAGLGFSLSAAAAKTDSPELREAAGQTRQTMRKLRSALVDIYPPSLQRAGLQAAIDDLAGSVDAEVDIEAPASTGLPLEKDALIFRTVQEGLRNVAKHANADHVTVRIKVTNGLVTAEVADDGRGFTPNGFGDREHMGLGLLSDLAEEFGGRLDVKSAPGAGTQLRLEVPAR